MNSRTGIITSAARNLADWHEASLKPLDIECRCASGFWHSLRRGPVIYVCGVTLAPARDAPGQMAEIQRMVEIHNHAYCTIIDSYAELDLTHLGFQRSEPEPWYIRPASSKPDYAIPPGLVIEEVGDAHTLTEFEIATWEGFESGPIVRAAGPGGQHHPGTLDDPHMHYFVGRLDGKAVTSSIAYIGKDITGVFGVSTLPEYRRRGFVEAITWTATMAAPHLPAHLEPSLQGASMEALVNCVRNLVDEVGRAIKRPPVEAAIFIKSKSLVGVLFSEKPLDRNAGVYHVGMVHRRLDRSSRACRIIFHEEGKSFPFRRLLIRSWRARARRENSSICLTCSSVKAVTATGDSTEVCSGMSFFSFMLVSDFFIIITLVYLYHSERRSQCTLGDGDEGL
jgi:hypothetical protein